MGPESRINKLIVILGQTATGKTDLSIKLGAWLNSKKAQEKFGIKGAEIISADSRQVYKGMDIGTGKITEKEKEGIPHHLLDVTSPKNKFTVAKYKKLAREAIDKVLKKKKIPILVGGTAFYIYSLVKGLAIPRVKPDWKLRKKLQKKTTHQLFEKLKKFDPRRAKTIDKYNKRRLIRALEIIEKTEKPVPLPKKKEPDFDVLKIGIKKTKKELKKLIKKRLKIRLKQGMVEEVKTLKKQGLSWERLEGFGLEYRYTARYLRGKLTREEMIEKIQKESEHFAKRQMTWFKKDKEINWIKSHKEAKNLVEKFL